MGNELSGDVCDCPVVILKSIPNKDFPVLPEDVVEDFSTDKYICCRLCQAVMSGKCDPDLERMHIGTLCHSRWLTFGGRGIKYYMSVRKPTKNLVTITYFCIKVYFPSWFHIKLHSKCTEGPQNFFNMVKLTRDFPMKDAEGQILGTAGQSAACHAR